MLFYQKSRFVLPSNLNAMKTFPSDIAETSSTRSAMRQEEEDLKFINREPEILAVGAGKVCENVDATLSGGSEGNSSPMCFEASGKGRRCNLNLKYK